MKTRVLIVKHDSKSVQDIRKKLDGKNDIELEELICFYPIMMELQ